MQYYKCKKYEVIQQYRYLPKTISACNLFFNTIFVFFFLKMFFPLDSSRAISTANVWNGVLHTVHPNFDVPRFSESTTLATTPYCSFGETHTLIIIRRLIIALLLLIVGRHVFEQTYDRASKIATYRISCFRYA